MHIKAGKGLPTHIQFDRAELYTYPDLLGDLWSSLDRLDGTTNIYVLKGYGQSRLYAKNIVLLGGFVLPESFYGSVFDLCAQYDLYHTAMGFSAMVIPTGRVLTGNDQNIPEPIWIGDLYNGNIVTLVDYTFQTLDSWGKGTIQTGGSDDL